MKLPIFNTFDKAKQTTWASQIDPVTSFPPVQGVLLTRITVGTGLNVIDHGLGRVPQGYIVTRVTGAFNTLYDQQEINPRPALTLFLTSSSDAIVDLWVF